MVRALLVGAALLVAVGAILAQLWARGVPVRAAIKMAAFALSGNIRMICLRVMPLRYALPGALAMSASYRKVA